jgi:hypothetical protein
MVSHRDQNSDKKLNSEDLETDAEVRKRPRGHEELRVLVIFFFQLILTILPAEMNRDSAHRLT